MASTAREKRAIGRLIHEIKADHADQVADYKAQIATLHATLQRQTTHEVIADSAELDAANARVAKLEEEVARLKAEINQLEAANTKLEAELPAPSAKPTPAKAAKKPAKPAPRVPSRTKKSCKKCDWSGRIRGNKCPKCHAKLT